MAHLNANALAQQIIADIQAGSLADDQLKLPAEPELMTHYQVTRYTLRQALKQLGNMGYTYQTHGVGTFVRPQQTTNSIALEHNGGLADEVARTGSQLTTKTAEQRLIDVADADFLPAASHFEDNEKLIEIRRFRELDGQPYLMERSYYLQSVIKTIPDSALYDSLFNYCEQQRETKIGFIDQSIMSEPLPAAASDFMSLPVGAPSLVVQDESYLITGQLLAFSKQYYNYKMAKLFMVKKIH